MKLFDVYPLLDLEPVKGEGSYIYTKDNEQYLDFYGGHAVNSIGHSHPHYISCLTQQLHKIGFYSNSVQNSLQKDLAARLGALSGYENYQLFLSNSGAEANENALKMASFHNGRSKVITFKKAFHGRTSAAISITDNKKYSAAINKSSDVIFLDLNDEERLKEELSKGDVCAVIVEGIQGVGGIEVPDDTFLKNMRQWCDEYDTLLICDEIQSGYGRTGRFFAHQYSNIKPDIITVAKGMGNGFPVAGTILSPKFKAVYGRLGSTFGGNYLACRAALAVLDVIENEQLVDRASAIGSSLIHQLADLNEIKEVRGRGLMIGMEFSFPVRELRKKLIEEEHIITGVSSNPNVCRLMPPLTVTQKETNQFINALKKHL